MRQRLGGTVLAILIGLDQLLQTLLVAPFALAGLAPVPDPDTTISGMLGRRAATGAYWARLGAALVDALFLILTLGCERDHCRKVALHEAKGLSAVKTVC